MSGDGRFVAFVTRDSLQGAWPTTIRPPNDDSNTTFDVFVYDRDTQPTPPIERVSRLSDGTGLDVDSRAPSLSDDGNRIAFETYSELILDDGNNAPGIVVRNRQTDSLDVVSQALDSSSGDGPSFDPAVAGNGSIVAFRSAATNLVAGDTNARHDIFVRDLAGSTTTRVSVATGGGQANGHSADPSVSDDGRFVAFRSDASNLVPADTNGRADIFVHDRTTGTTVRVGQPSGSESNGSSAAPAISGDGAWVVFESDATNLVPGDDNAARDIFRVPNPLATP
jgi:Tol biopolymer transport system component